MVIITTVNCDRQYDDYFYLDMLPVAFFAPPYKARQIYRNLRYVAETGGNSEPVLTQQDF